jgi:hypothetical protein
VWINRAIRKMQAADFDTNSASASGGGGGSGSGGDDPGPPLRFHVLSPAAFPCGQVYYESTVRVFFDDEPKCDNCVVVHNNWITGLAAKTYRFREHLQWHVDEDGYYTVRR